jgi:hypothetical protein
VSLASRCSLLTAETGPVTFVAALAATDSERQAAYRGPEARRMLALVASSGVADLAALSGLLGDERGPPSGAGASAPTRRLLAAVEAGSLLVVAGWSWSGLRPEARGRSAAASLVRAAMGGRRELFLDGIGYLLCEPPFVGQLGDYRVVPAEGASAVLARLAHAASPAQRVALQQAAALLSGAALFLLRRAPPPAPILPAEPALTPSAIRGAPARKVAFELAIVDSQTGRGIRDLSLSIEPPDGSTRRLTTDSDGVVQIEDLDPGSCLVTSSIADARLATSYAVSGAAAVPSKGPAPKRRADVAHMVDVARHRVGSGQTPASIEREWGVPWAQIALFNWGTTDPDALEEHYRTTLGCTRRTDDGKRLVFDDGDEPGLLLIPRPWQVTLPVSRGHRILVSPLRTIFLSLANERDLPLPGVRYQIQFADGSTQDGALGRAGIARIEGVPEGAFLVSYPDEADLLAMSMAACVRRAFDEQVTAPLFTLLMQEQPVVERAVAAYDRYLNDLTGKGLAADIDQVVTDPDARQPLLALCAMAGLDVAGVAAIAVEK